MKERCNFTALDEVYLSEYGHLVWKKNQVQEVNNVRVLKIERI